MEKENQETFRIASKISSVLDSEDLVNLIPALCIVLGAALAELALQSDAELEDVMPEAQKIVAGVALLHSLSHEDKPLQ